MDGVRLIDANALASVYDAVGDAIVRAADKDYGWQLILGQVRRFSRDLRDEKVAPTIKAVPEVRGTWETTILYDGDGNRVFIHAHKCGYESRGYKEHGTPFCPGCGARMNEKEDMRK